MAGEAPIDVDEFAKRIRGARALQHRPLTAEELSVQLGKLGIAVSKDRIYAWERGESLPRFHEFFALVVILETDFGFEFWKPVFRPDLWDRFMKVFKQGLD